jgi:hypothetical protein
MWLYKLLNINLVFILFVVINHYLEYTFKWFLTLQCWLSLEVLYVSEEHAQTVERLEAQRKQKKTFLKMQQCLSVWLQLVAYATRLKSYFVSVQWNVMCYIHWYTCFLICSYLDKIHEYPSSSNKDNGLTHTSKVCVSRKL